MAGHRLNTAYVWTVFQSIPNLTLWFSLQLSLEVGGLVGVGHCIQGWSCCHSVCPLSLPFPLMVNKGHHNACPDLLAGLPRSGEATVLPTGLLMRTGYLGHLIGQGRAQV